MIIFIDLIHYFFFGGGGINKENTIVVCRNRNPQEQKDLSSCCLTGRMWGKGAGLEPATGKVGQTWVLARPGPELDQNSPAGPQVSNS